MNTLQEIFAKDLQELIFNGLEFTIHAQNHDGFVEGSVVRVPNHIETIEVRTNPTGTATANTRSDAFTSYNVDYYATDPVKVLLKDEFQTNYSLRESSIKSHAQQLSETIGDTVLYNWASGVTASNIFRTTGATSSDNLTAIGTGSRNKLVKEDLKKVVKQMDKDKLPKEGRFCILPSDMYYELFDDATLLSFDNNNRKPLPDGVITQVMGVNIMSRSTVAHFDGTTLEAPASIAGTASGNHGAIVWHESAVAKAYDGSKAFVTNEDPMNYGSSFLSAGSFMGSAALRQGGDWKGVYAIVQA